MRHLIFATLLLGSSLVFSEEPRDQFIDEHDQSSLNHGETLARVTYAGSYVYLTGDQGESNDVVRNMPVLSGDYLESRHGSYAEVEFIDGSLIQIDNRTKLEFQAVNELYGDSRLTIIKLHKGSLFLHITEHPTERMFRVDTKAGSAYVDLPGIYRVDQSGSRMKLKVFRGFAELSGTEDSAPIYSGEYATIHNMHRPSRVRPFNSFHGDRFERWAFDRRPVSDSVSSKYVDDRIAYYSRDLDDHGEWRYDDDLGNNVWVPYVSASWQPYNRGYWTSAGSAMTWVSYDAFGWVTHHYGRWGWTTGLGWYWIPGRYYSPGWVAWTTYDTYVGWCPLGYANRPWYYRNNRPSTVIVNNYFGNRWNYVRTDAIVRGRRNYESHRVVHRGPRKITTRSIYVNREDFGESARFARVIREPAVNRRRVASRTVKRGTMVSTSGERRSRVAIQDRATGTRAVSRNLSRRVVEDRVKRTRTVERNRDEFDVNRGSRSYGSDNSRRADTRRGYDDDRARSTVKRGNDNGNNRSGNATRNNTSDRVTTSRSGNSSSVRRNDAASSNSRVNRSNSSRSRDVNVNRSNSSRSRDVNVNRSNSSRSRDVNVNRSRGSSSNNSKATRSNGNSSRNSNATRSNGNSSRNSNATRSRGNSSRSSSATRSSGSSSRNSSATRSNRSSSRSSNATRSNSSRSRPTINKSTAGRKTGGESRTRRDNR